MPVIEVDTRPDEQEHKQKIPGMKLFAVKLPDVSEDGKQVFIKINDKAHKKYSSC
jgi:hypothetical protein